MTDVGAELQAFLPVGSVLTSDDDLVPWTRDWWPLLRLRETRGDALERPAAVALPTNVKDVAAILAWASARGVPIVPRGLGSGVCGGAVPPHEAVVLDLSALDEIVSLDEESLVVHVQAGVRGETLERWLNDRHLTLGHYPQSMSLSSVGGWVATWSAGQASPGYGSIEARVVGLAVALADGAQVTIRPTPRPVAGPDLKRLILGSEGTLAVVTDVWLSCANADPDVSWQAFGFDDFVTCLRFARDVRRSDVALRVLRGWDPDDSVNAFDHRDGSVGLVGIASSVPGLSAQQEWVAGRATADNATPLPSEWGDRWWAHRLDAVDTFERILGPERALGPGSLIDTVEVTALWRDLPAVYHGVMNALRATTARSRCHFSHVYDSGAALYCTFFFAVVDDTAIDAAYRTAWTAVTHACHEAGGTIAHHHGVGRLKAPSLEAAIGSEALDLLSRLKACLDPGGVLNPGALLPAVAR